jgi:hypothetical protein
MAAVETIAPRARTTTGRNREKARDRRKTWNEAMGTFRVAMGSRTLLERFGDDGSTLLGSQPAAGTPAEALVETREKR